MKNEITIEQLNSLVQEYIALEQNEMENSTEWAYAVLEPALLISETVTLNFLRQVERIAFEAIAYCFESIIIKFQSAAILREIEELYEKFYGSDENTDFYLDNIKGLKNCIKEL